MQRTHKTRSAIKGYPYTLFVGLDLPHFGQGVRTGHSPRMIKAQSTGYAGLALKDYERLELSSEDQVLIRSPQGSLKLPVKPDPRLDKGMIFISAAAPGAQVNHLFSPDIDPARLPCYCRVSLRKV
jgi:predicted molibdopterin-dependent oxidoreductase YjgC